MRLPDESGTFTLQVSGGLNERRLLFGLGGWFRVDDEKLPS